MPTAFTMLDELISGLPRNTVETADIRPLANVIEREKEYEFQVTLPGLNKEEITVQIEDGKLFISGERKRLKLNDKERFLLNETVYGSIKRVFALPEDVNTDIVEAEFKNGILNIRIGKTEPKKGTTIEIK